MKPSFRSRADLVILLAKLPPEQRNAAALAAGFIQRESTSSAKKSDGASEEVAHPAVGRQDLAPFQIDAPPYQPADLPGLPFWRVAAEVREAEASQQPPHLKGEPLKALPVSNPHQLRPQQKELLPPARQARLLRRQLAVPQPGRALDVARLCGLLAQRRLPSRLPRLKRDHWPARLHLVLDVSLPMRPYWEDFWRLAERLRHFLGERLTLWRSLDGEPLNVEAEDGARHRLPLNEGSLLFLSDAGMYTPGSGKAKCWEHFGRHCARAGARPLLIAPVPPRKVPLGVAAVFRLLLWDQGSSLHTFRFSHHGMPPAGCDSAPHQGGEKLLAAIAHASRVEPPLLRDLRLALTELGTDIGSEYEVWCHAKVSANILACTIAREHRAEVQPLPKEWLRKVAALRYAGNLHLSPLVQAEEALAEGQYAQPKALEEAETLAQNLCATLRSGGNPMMGELAGYLLGMAARRPDLLTASPHLARAWVLARRDELADGSLTRLPAGVSQAMLDEVLGVPPRGRPCFLGQIGYALALFPTDSPQPVCRLAELEEVADYWQVEVLRDGQPPSPLRLLGRFERFTPDPAAAYRLTLGRHRLELDAVRRPEWAIGMGRDRDGLFAELPDGRRVYWVARGRMPVESESGSTVQEFSLPHGYWWAEAEHRAWIKAGKRFERPAWAARHGVDQSGWWAEFEVKGVAQRLRWIPPGQFQMGSPPEEPERSADDSEWSELQHPVLLTEGYWLADTACTQALWRAVMGDSPSGFKGEDKPVETVSWQDISENFLPALNALVPGLEAALPSEAQWEHACRAGTETPFWFGEEITPEQVNYDGNYPYRGGEKGLYREQTVAVKALPANGWGLYQMHGNVWEWCADWVGPYAPGVATDPAGPPSGRARVLRGGSWIYSGRYCRSAERFGYVPGERFGHFGFRLARGSSPRQAGSAVVAGVAAGSGATAAAPDSTARRQDR